MNQTSLALVLLVWSVITAAGRHIHSYSVTPTVPATSTTASANKDEEDLITALGEFGLDLLHSDLNPGARNKSPEHLSLRGRDIQNNPRLQHSVVKYLLQYGYLEVVKQETEQDLIEGDTVIGETDLSEALKRYQRLFGLEVTGKVTEETLRKMSEVRCGVKDEEYHRPGRGKRFTVKRKLWRRKRLYYWYDPNKYSKDLPKDVLRREFEKSLMLWSKAGGITFIELPPHRGRRADIKISFETGEHGDKHPFDGSGGIVAHAFFPKKGLLHFDDAEEFTTDSYGVNFHFIATHELGHILGIDHTYHDTAVMFPLYGVYPSKVELHPDDKAAAIAAIGRGQGRVIPQRNRG